MSARQHAMFCLTLVVGEVYMALGLALALLALRSLEPAGWRLGFAVYLLSLIVLWVVRQPGLRHRVYRRSQMVWGVLR
jgi:hypothetical protein